MSGTARANSLRLEWASCVWGPGRRTDNTEAYKQMGVRDKARTGIRSLMLWCYLLIPWTVLTTGVSDKMQDRVMKKHTNCGVSTGMKWGHVGIWKVLDRARAAEEQSGHTALGNVEPQHFFHCLTNSQPSHHRLTFPSDFPVSKWCGLQCLGHAH